MSKFSDSTFYLAPSGYRETILFPQKPLSSIGHLSVGRASSATRTNPAGQVEDVCYNLLQYSEDFSNASWSKTASSITTNTTTAPNGTLTADSLIEDTSNGLHICGQSITLNSSICTVSIYAKANGRNWMYISMVAASNYGAYYDLQNGVLGTVESNVTATVTSVGNGWYLCTITTNSAVSSARCQVYTSTGNGVNSYTGNGTSGLYIWGAQLVQGNLPKTYLYTSDRLNFPRVDFSDGSASFLLEPQRTNLLQNSGWAGGGTTPTNWVLVVGSGTSTPITSIKNTGITAYRFQGTSQRQIFVQTLSVTNGVSYTISVYVESVAAPSSIFNAILVSGTGTTQFYINGSVVSGSNDIVAGAWYSCVFVATATGTADFRFGFGCNGLATGDYVLSMPQVEVGAYSTSFILTPTSATATRLADTFTRNNIFTNNLISSSGGTWFVDLKVNLSVFRDAFSNGLQLADNNTSGGISGNGFIIRRNDLSQGRLNIQKVIAGNPTALFQTTTDTVKAAIKWNGSTADVFVNGIKQVSATSFTTTNMEFLLGYATDVPKYITQMALWNTPLSDSQCIEMTGVAYTTPAQAYGSLNLVSESPDCLYTSVNTINRI